MSEFLTLKNAFRSKFVLKRLTVTLRRKTVINVPFLCFLYDLLCMYCFCVMDIYPLLFLGFYLISLNFYSKMIHRLKRQKKLNNSTLRQLLVPILEHLDLDGVYVTEGTIKLIWRSCPNLKVISLKDCGYVSTDNLMEQLLKVSKILTKGFC